MKKNTIASLIISGMVVAGVGGTFAIQHENNKELAAQVQELQATVSEKEESVAQLREEIETYRENVFSLNQTIAEMQEEYQKEYDNKVAELEKTKSQLEEVKSKLENTPSEVASHGVSRGTLGYKQVYNMEATAYYTGEPGVNTKTFTETTATVGRTVAVDRNIIKLGSKLYIEFPTAPQFNGYYIAEDVGGAIKGNIIDLYVDGPKTAYDFGRRQCIIYVLD